MKAKKGIFYIYSYRDGRRERNVGFAKLKIRNDKCKLVISLKPPMEYVAEEVQICLYKREGNKLLGFNLGYLQPLTEVSSFRTEIDLKNLEEAGFSVDDMSGVYLYSSEHSRFVFSADMEAADIYRTPKYLSDSQLQCVV